MINVVLVCGSVYISSYLSIVVRRASYLVMSFVSAERLYAILRPFHIRQFFLTRYPVTVTFCTYLFSATWHVYMLTKSSIKTVSAHTVQAIVMDTSLLFFVSLVRKLFLMTRPKRRLILLDLSLCRKQKIEKKTPPPPSLSYTHALTQTLYIRTPLPQATACRDCLCRYGTLGQVSRYTDSSTRTATKPTLTSQTVSARRLPSS